MRVLSLNPHFDKVSLWRQNTTSIASLDASWHAKSVLSKALRLLKVAGCFDVIVFYWEPRLPALVGLLKHFGGIEPRLVLQEFYCDITRYRLADRDVTAKPWDAASYLMYRSLARTMDAIIVHTSAEVSMYSSLFKVAKSRFHFIPYFGYHDAIHYPSTLKDRASECGYVLAIGRHRDFECFITAIAGGPWKGLVVAGDSDREEVGDVLPANIEAHYEVSWEEYRSFIARSAVVVIPLHANRWQRSLGQIAMLESMLMRKPVVAARTFHLADYATDEEVLYYRPGDARHLRNQVQRIIQDVGLRNKLLENAFTRVQTEFTQERYITQLLQRCEEVYNKGDV